MKLLKLSLVAAVITICTACAKIEPINPRGDATYRITFTGAWTQADHGPVPGNAHFTTFIGLTHNAQVMLFAPQSSASRGVEEVAETGQISTLSDEIDATLAAGNGFSKLIMEVSNGPTGTGSAEFTVSQNRPFLSAMSMIAPSPDWFIGIHDFRLFENNVWVDDVTFNVGMYDAGTEEGDQFSLNNPDTNPRGLVTRLDENNASSLANATTGITPIGTIRIQKID